MKLDLLFLKKFLVFGLDNYLGKFDGFLVDTKNLALTHVLVKVKKNLFRSEVHSLPIKDLATLNLKKRIIYMDATCVDLKRPYTLVENEIWYKKTLLEGKKEFFWYHEHNEAGDNGLFVHQKIGFGPEVDCAITTNCLIKMEKIGDGQKLGRTKSLIIDLDKKKILAFKNRKRFSFRYVYLDHKLLSYINLRKLIAHFEITPQYLDSLVDTDLDEYNNHLMRSANLHINHDGSVLMDEIEDLNFNQETILHSEGKAHPDIQATRMH